MKQTNQLKIYTLQPTLTKIQSSIIKQGLPTSVNPELDKNNSNDTTIYCNPAVHLKKNFLKFTKAASTISNTATNHSQPNKQQSRMKEQANILMTNSINDSLRFIREENTILRQKIEFIENQSHNKQAQIAEKDAQLSELFRQVRQMGNQLVNLRQNKCELTQLVNYFKSKSSQCCSCRQNDQKFNYLKQKYEQVTQKSKHLEIILQNKDSLLQNTIKSKNDQYKSAISSKNNQIKSLELRISLLQKDNQRLYQQLTRGVVVKEDQTLNKFQKMGTQFQLRIGEVINENIKMKNTINHLQGKIEQLKSKNDSFQNTIRAYQSSQQLYNSSRTKTQLESLRAELEVAKQEYDKMASKYEFEILRLQNIIGQKKIDQQQTLFSFSDRERLRQALMNAIWEIQSLKSKPKK